MVGALDGGRARVSMSLACGLGLWNGRLMVRPSLVLVLGVERVVDGVDGRYK